MTMMANPRRNSYANSNSDNSNNSVNVNNNNIPFQSQTLTRLSSLKYLLKKPHAIPFLLSIFLFLTWVFLKIQHSSSHLSSHRWVGDEQQDRNANLVRFPTSRFIKDKRGWLLDPISVALDSGISGGALNCVSLHVGEIRPGSLRGNHRHYTCNETFLIWGARTVFRLENNAIDKGYAEVTIAADEVAVVASPSGTAHALVNIDPARTTFFLGCQDSVITYNSSSSDFNVWKDL